MYGYEASGSGRIGASRSTKTVRKPSSSTTLASPRATGCFASAPSTRCFSCPRERPKEREEPSVAPVAERKAPGSTPPKRTPEERARPSERKSSRNTLATHQAPRKPTIASGPKAFANSTAVSICCSRPRSATMSSPSRETNAARPPSRSTSAPATTATADATNADFAGSAASEGSAAASLPSSSQLTSAVYEARSRPSRKRHRSSCFASLSQYDGGSS
mmetsp:Transcript_13183/g.43906  ORF Transcript_13183/g.43906 Transcript_13183/m.43906 type:complete len:219 (+) Transcript_13183:322-978(+)